VSEDFFVVSVDSSEANPKATNYFPGAKKCCPVLQNVAAFLSTVERLSQIFLGAL
jgi:hypothetical protein